MVRRRADISEGLIHSSSGGLATLDELVPEAAERRWIGPRLATLLDPGMPGDGRDSSSLHGAGSSSACQIAPAVLVFEDLNGPTRRCSTSSATWPPGRAVPS
jgi:hypothetical protein